MYYWRKPYFDTLKEIAEKAGIQPAWAEYAAFCLEYESGLRKNAFATLERFIAKFERSPFSKRREFVSWLLTQAEGKEGRHMLLPHPLKIRLVEPTLLEWTTVEPACSEPHRWLGGPEHLKQALQLDPEDELARRKLIIWTMGQVSAYCHPIPKDYTGDFKDDLAALAEADELVPELPDGHHRDFFASQIRFDRARILEHLRKVRGH